MANASIVFPRAPADCWQCLLQSSPLGCKAFQMWKCFHARCPGPEPRTAAVAQNQNLLRAELGAPSQPCMATPGDSRASPVGVGLSPHSDRGCRLLAQLLGHPSHSHSRHHRDVHTHLNPNQRPKVGKERAWQLCLAPRDTGGCEMPQRASGSPSCPSLVPGMPAHRALFWGCQMGRAGGRCWQRGHGAALLTSA